MKLDGKKTAARIAQETKKEVRRLQRGGITPKIVTFRFGEDPSAKSYERGLKRRCEEVGISLTSRVFTEDRKVQGMESLKEASDDDSVGGILLLEPLPHGFDREEWNRLIPPEKDVDCVTLENQGRIYRGDFSGYLPSTPAAVMEMVKDYGPDLEGKNVLVINRTTVVGRPLIMMLLDKNATVTVAHSKTKDLPDLAKRADVIFTAMGQSGLIDEKWVSPGQYLYDIAIAFDEDGKMTGDLNEERIKNIVEAYSPVPGGVGAVTNAVLLKQVLKFYQ